MENTAGEKLQKIITRFMQWREEEKQKLINNPKLRLGDVTTINLNIIGVSEEIYPPVGCFGIHRS